MCVVYAAVKCYMIINIAVSKLEQHSYLKAWLDTGVN